MPPCEVAATVPQAEHPVVTSTDNAGQPVREMVRYSSLANDRTYPVTNSGSLHDVAQAKARALPVDDTEARALPGDAVGSSECGALIRGRGTTPFSARSGE